MPVDKNDMLSVLESFHKQCREALTLPQGMTIKDNINAIVVAGMGGSAIGGDLIKSYLSGSSIPVFVNRNYSLPKFVDSNTLVFIVSYSGNTEETLSCFEEAKARNSKIIAITSGGKISELCSKVIKVPAGLQPRAAIGYLFFPMLGILHNMGLINVNNNDLNEMLSIIANVEPVKKKAQDIARKIRERIPVIYSSELFSPVAYRWKCQFNENSKWPAYYNVFPEMNHNELASIHGFERSKLFLIMLRNPDDNPRIQKRMDITKDIMSKRADVEVVQPEGSGMLARMFYLIYLGDFVSYYLAILKRVDPTPVDVIEEFKKSL